MSASNLPTSDSTINKNKLDSNEQVQIKLCAIKNSFQFNRQQDEQNLI